MLGICGSIYYKLMQKLIIELENDLSLYLLGLLYYFIN